MKGKTVSAQELRRIISALPESEDETMRLEKYIQLRKPGRPAWYRSQKEHWLGWLKDYNGPGYYGRKNWERDARYIYNHVQYAPMLLWLGESLGISRTVLKKASEAALAAGDRFAAQCAAVRSVIPWAAIEARIAVRK